jgi:aryl-alcohol dehydrogenase-like predicted oxidoreductase
MVLATKGGIRPGTPYDSSAEWIRTACVDSLRRLGLDHVDLWQLHRPDPMTPPAEVAGALADLVREGFARAVGVSNHTPAQQAVVAEAMQHERVTLATIQPELSLVNLGPMWDTTLARCSLDGVVPLAWSPLAGGSLAQGAAGASVTSILDELAAREGCDPSVVAVAFVLALPGRPVAIVGSQRPDRLRALAAAGSVHLDRADCYRLIAATGEELP